VKRTDIEKKLYGIIQMGVFIASGVIILMNSNHNIVLISMGIGFVLGSILMCLHIFEIIDLRELSK